VKGMQEKLDFTFLTKEQTFGEYQLEILKKYGTKCAITDFAILLGGYVSFNDYTSEGNNLNNRTAYWWTKTPYDNDVIICFPRGFDYYDAVVQRSISSRPVLLYSLITSQSLNKVKRINGILEVEYGEYPQTVVSEDFSKILEEAYSNNKINKTGKSYTTDSVSYFFANIPFQEKTYSEYEYKGKRYIRFVGDLNEEEILSDGRTIQYDDVYWVKVEPIKWMVDEKTNIALSVLINKLVMKTDTLSIPAINAQLTKNLTKVSAILFLNLK